MGTLKSRLYDVINRDKRETITLFFLMHTTMLIMMVLYWAGSKWGLMDEDYIFFATENVLLIALIFSGLLGSVGTHILKEFYYLMEKEKELSIQTFQLEQMEEANSLLHAQRHDFLNNIQVVAGLLYLGNHEKAQNYLKDFTDGLKLDKREVESIKKLGHPQLYTLFLNKLHKCKELNIKISYDIGSDIHLEEFHAIDLVRIMGNLLDNAIYGVKDLNKELTMVKVNIYKDGKKIVFGVYNPAPIIPDELKDKIFQRGFTTKHKEGSGMGLWNVKNIVGKYGGMVELISKDGFGTKFIVRLPVK